MGRDRRTHGRSATTPSRATNRNSQPSPSAPSATRTKAACRARLESGSRKRSRARPSTASRSNPSRRAPVRLSSHSAVERSTVKQAAGAEVVELDLPIQRCFQFDHRASQLFLLQVQLHLIHLQLVQQLERVCGRRRRRCEFVQDRKRSRRVRPCVMWITVPGQARKSPQAQAVLGLTDSLFSLDMGLPRFCIDAVSHGTAHAPRPCAGETRALSRP